MTVDRRWTAGYDLPQVLNTLNVAVPRADIAVFLCPNDCPPMEGGPVRKAGRSSTFDCSTPSTHALNSVERSLECRSDPL